MTQADAPNWQAEAVARLSAIVMFDDAHGDIANSKPDELRDALRVAAKAIRKLNRLRSNVVATQNASWSNSLYPMVAILDEAGIEVQGATKEQQQEHLHCYGGAGRTPKHLDAVPYESPIGRAHTPDTSGSVLIHAERWRQIDEEGWTPEHDDEHSGSMDGALARAGAAYAMQSYGSIHAMEFWPFSMSDWKPSADPIRNLVKAGALIAAEIDRLQRAEVPQTEATE